MAGQITVVNTVNAANAIQTAATRALAQFTNSFDSVVSDLADFETSLGDAGLDQDTLTEIDTIKAGIIAQATAALEARLAVLEGLTGA